VYYKDKYLYRIKVRTVDVFLQDALLCLASDAGYLPNKATLWT
jgi:hypothetical protein